MGLIRPLFQVPACVGLAIAALAQAPPASPSPASFHEVLSAGQEGWVSLFEGASIKGWKISEPGRWDLSDGLLSGVQGKILNRWCWTDFELQIRYRGEGSLLFRVGSDQIGHIGFDQPGYEFDLVRNELRTASGVTLATTGSSREHDKWHALWVSASLGVFRFSSDGKQILQVEDGSSPLKGRIGFSAGNRGLEIEFVRVRALARAETANIPAENYYCYVCHGNFEYLNPFVEAHEEAEVLCSDCHGSSLEHRSDEDNVVPPDIIYRRPQIELKCLECHEQHEEKDSSVGEGIKNPVCTDCHEHRVLLRES